jgi:hypothetical protein
LAEVALPVSLSASIAVAKDLLKVPTRLLQGTSCLNMMLLCGQAVVDLLLWLWCAKWLGVGWD